MRYMGDPLTDLLNVSIPVLDPTAKAAAVAKAGQVDDAHAQDMLDVVDATPLGKKTKYMRIGLGAAAGLVVGFLVAKKTKRR